MLALKQNYTWAHIIRRFDIGRFEYSQLFNLPWQEPAYFSLNATRAVLRSHLEFILRVENVISSSPAASPVLRMLTLNNIPSYTKTGHSYWFRNRALNNCVLLYLALPWMAHLQLGCLAKYHIVMCRTALIVLVILLYMLNVFDQMLWTVISNRN